MNQALSFGLLLGGCILLYAALTGHGPGDVLQGKAGQISSTSSIDLSSILQNGVAGVGQAAGSAIAGVGNRVGTGYANPLAGATVTPERIDQGVDYAGTGTISAIGDAIVTSVFHPGSGSGWPGPGGYVEYKLTSGPDAGAYIYAAEGVAPTVTTGQRIKAGDTIADIIANSPTGFETGVGSGSGTGTYAAAHGGYSEGELTAAGQWFSNLISELGGPAGLAEGRTASGQMPPFALPQLVGAGGPSGGSQSLRQSGVS